MANWKHLFAFFLLVCLGCKAQTVSPADLNKRIERRVRATFNIPTQVNVDVSPRKPQSDFPGYDTVTVTFSNGAKTQSHDFLLSQDGKTLASVVKMDVSKDPYQAIVDKIDVAGRPYRGAKDAKVTVVVYDDFQCPFCSRFHSTLFDNVMKTYGDRVKVIYKDYPLFEIHPWAGRAAINSHCLMKQSMGAYWDFADYVHANPKAIQGEKRPIENQFAELDKVTLDIAGKHSVNNAAMQQCVKDQPREELDASVKEAQALGVNATPAVFVNGYKIDGAVPATELTATLDRALTDAGVKTSAQQATAAAPAPQAK